MLRAICEIAGLDPATAAAVNVLTGKCDDAYANRRAKLEAITKEFENDELAQVLGMGPMQHQYKAEATAGAAGGSDASRDESVSAVSKAKPVPPFPFAKVDRLVDEGVKKRLELVHEFSRKLKQKRSGSGEVTECVICGGVIPADHDVRHCDECFATVHRTCLTTGGCGWLVQDDSNTVLCTTCRLQDGEDTL